MSQLIHINEDYGKWVQAICQRFRQFQIKTAVRINTERLEFNWELGRDIVELRAEKCYGKGVMKELSRDLRNQLPGVGGLTPLDLYYCKRFYTLYSQVFANFSQVEKKSLDKVGSSPLPPAHRIDITSTSSDFPINIFAIPWGHHKVIIGEFETEPKKALFYATKTIENSWSRAALQNAIAGDLYSHYGKAITNFHDTLSIPNGDLAEELVKDPLNLSFISLREKYNEAQLKEAMVQQIGKLLMELGRGFAYMGREYLLEIPDKELSSDLLFYNTLLHAYVVVEVKTREFTAADLGQLSGYMSTANHILKTDLDNPTVGLLICLKKNNLFTQYCLEGYNQPIAVTAYKGIQILPKDFDKSLPTITEIQKSI